MVGVGSNPTWDHYLICFWISLCCFIRTVCSYLRLYISSSTHDIDILGPMILQGAPIDWKVMAVSQPNRLKPEVIPRHCKKIFSQQGINQVVLPPTTENFPSPPIDNTAPLVPPRYYLRSHRTAVTWCLRSCFSSLLSIIYTWSLCFALLR